MNNRFSLDGKRALVTGGSSGIGYAIAQGLAESGADVVIAARDSSRLESAREKLSAFGNAVHAFEFDVSNLDGIQPFYDKIVGEVGPIDILVNNAGRPSRRAPAHELTPRDWQETIEVNLSSVFFMSQAFARERIASGNKGRIINIASLMSEDARPNNAPYASSKGGIRQLTKALAIDWASHGILVNAIGPGMIHTNITHPLFLQDDFHKWVLSKTPLNRWGEPTDLAGVAIFLASEASAFMTGQIVYVDGGWLASM
ncbi:MAG: glucose 1-dehydrogenase [Armatimonadetes bacterium]|nr:glucose 1-dehydrogenase [Armatimonadota bacterium]